MTYKKIYQEIFKKLNRSYQIIDYGIDWLRLKNNNCTVIDILKQKTKQNSTTGQAGYISISGVEYMILPGKSTVGDAYFFVTSISYNGINVPITVARLTINNKNVVNKYLLDIYGLCWQLYKQYNYDIESFIRFFFSEDKINISRVDYNFNFSVDFDIGLFLEKIYKKYKVKNKNLYNNESLALGLYQKKGRNNGKVVYGLTKRFGIRLYNKTKNIYDLGLAGLFEQYQGLNVLRLEGILGSEATKSILYKNIQQIEEEIKEKILGQVSIIPSNNIRIKKSKNYKELKKMKNDLESRLKTYVLNGGSLEDIETISNYLDNQYIIEGYFKK